MTQRVTVAYATAQKQMELPVEVAADCTVIRAIRQSGVLDHFPEIDLSTAAVGIDGRCVVLDDLLHCGDRIEIYRPLQINPKEARRLRAATLEKRQRQETNRR